MNTRQASLCGIVALLLFLWGGLALADEGPDVDWDVIGSGGGHVEAGAVTLDYTIGQPVVGSASAGAYDLCAGFWCAGIEYDLFLPVVLKDA